MNRIQGSCVRNTPDIQGSLYDVFHCYHEDAQADGVAKQWNNPSTKGDQVVCCWCGKKRNKFRVDVAKGHGPFTPLDLHIDTRDDEECPVTKVLHEEREKP